MANRYVRSFVQSIPHQRLFIGAWISWIGCVLATIAHYAGLWYGNSWTWVLWIAASALFIASCISGNTIRWFTNVLARRRVLMIIGLVSLLFFVTHVWNWSTAPWNNFGLFDDAAWDIYFANIHIGRSPFQAAFLDMVGYATRETGFHYYITFFFQLFGHNLFVFNCALLVLGYITVLVTILLIDRLFHNDIVTICSAFILNFFPLQYLHIFMGHRYAIAPPLMVLSLYFLYTAFMNASRPRAALSAVFGALCWGSAVMGKQYIYGLFISGFLLLLWKQQRALFFQFRHIIITWILSFVIAMTPVYIYIVFHASTYAIREQGLLRDFLSAVQQQGWNGVLPYADQIVEVFTAPITYRRQFLFDYPLIPYAYYLLLIPSIVIAVIKKRYELVILAVLPIAASFISGAYDFRILIAVPIWVMLMAYGMNETLQNSALRKQVVLRYAVIVAAFGSVLVGGVSTGTYLWGVSKNPHAQYLLPHKDVAVSRLVQDIVIGAETPSIQMKHQELRVGQQNENSAYDVLVCPAGAYAIMHVFLQAYDDKKILSFCDQGIEQLKTPREILQDNIHAILAYIPEGKDLKLIWEVTDTAHPAISVFNRIVPYGKTDIVTESIEGVSFSLYILTIPHDAVGQFQQDVSRL